jgi:hypothetical protein
MAFYFLLTYFWKFGKTQETRGKVKIQKKKVFFSHQQTRPVLNALKLLKRKKVYFKKEAENEQGWERQSQMLM